MLKNISLALVGLVATASATSHHEIDLFNPMNFVNVNTPKNLFNNLISEIQGKNVQDTGSVTWTLCSGFDKNSVFNIHLDDTFADPDPAVKGQSVKLNLAGVFNKATEVSNADINVVWSGTPLHKEDHVLS